jgi:cell division protein FtsZ
VLINITGSSDLTLFEVNEASTLIQEAAHEEANIIFGAVIDERMPEGEMRVTVIATGLDGDRVRRGRDSGRRAEDAPNVTRLRRDPVPLEDRLPAAEDRVEPAQAILEVEDPAPAERYEVGAGQEHHEDWVSPFDDELDVPTFLRRDKRRDGDDDREEPAFLRRSAD